MNNRAILTRISDDGKESLGSMTATKDTRSVFLCKTLELSFLGNAKEISCIPVGEYNCQYTRSNRLSALKKTDIFTYEIMNVPHRGGIRIHSANYFYQLKGCISLGSAFKDINSDLELDVIHSGDTVRKLEHFFLFKPFFLTIKNSF